MKLSTRKAPTERLPLPRKRKKGDCLKSLEEENRSLWLRVAELEEEKQALKNEVRMLELQLLQPDLSSKKQEKQKEKKVLKNPTSGFSLTISSNTSRALWYKTGEEKCLMDLWGELLPSLRHDHPNKDPYVMLDLIFSIFNTGFGFTKMSEAFLIEGQKRSDRNLSDWFHRGLESLQPWAEKQISWLSDEDWLTHSLPFHQAYPDYQDTLFYFVDGTVVETQNPYCCAGSRAMRNGKHGIPAYVYFIVVAPSGRVVYLSDKFMTGKTHDKTHWVSEEVCEKLDKVYGGGKVVLGGKEYQRELGGDKAYPFAPAPKEWRWRITKSGKVQNIWE